LKTIREFSYLFSALEKYIKTVAVNQGISMQKRADKPRCWYDDVPRAEGASYSRADRGMAIQVPPMATSLPPSRK
jgi:hypothetical protein